MPRHLRVLASQVQSELSTIIDGAQREQSVKRPLYQDAMEAHFALMSVWLRRQIALEEHVPAKRSVGERLSRAFVRLISQHTPPARPWHFTPRNWASRRPILPAW